MGVLVLRPGKRLPAFHGPRRLAVYNADGTLGEETEREVA